jgi:hypothetical protein
LHEPDRGGPGGSAEPPAPPLPPRLGFARLWRQKRATLQALRGFGAEDAQPQKVTALR